MIEINKRNARMLSMLGQRGSIFGVALPEIASEMDNFRLVAADLSLNSGLSKFIATHPQKYINIGIAEQNMIGVAAGLARGGNCVVATTYATFLTMRAFEQIRNNLGYMKSNVKLVGASSGLSMGTGGNTHYALEDIALMRVVPNMTVISPADASEAVKALYAACEIDGPVYIRPTGHLNCPIIFKEEYNFTLGAANVLLEGRDVAIIACGTMVHEAMLAAESLKVDGISSFVVNMHTIKPLDTCVLDRLFEDCRLIVSVEEHSVIGGLGSAVAEYKTGVSGAPPQLILGLPDAFGETAEQEYLLEKYGLTSNGIADSIRSFLC